MITIASGKFSNPRGTKQEAKKAKASAGSTAQSKQEKAKKGSKNRKIAIISICSAVLVVLIGIIVGVYFYANADDGLILNNVTAAGINIGGMTPEEATSALRRATELTYTQEDMVIEMPDTTLKLSPADTGAQLDIDAVVQAAYDYGRTGSRPGKIP